MKVFHSLAFITTVFFLGCSSDPTIGNQMHMQSKETENLAKEWDMGNKLINKGSKIHRQGEALVQKGESKIHEGEKLVEKGQSKMNEGDQKMKLGEQKILTSENAFDDIFQPQNIDYN